MDALGRIIRQPESEAQRTQSQTEISLRRFEAAESDFEADLGEIIERTVAAANQPPLEPEEFLLRISAWSEILFKVVPGERLFDAFDRAKREHNSPFAINAYEIKQAWMLIEKEELDSNRKTLEALRESDPVRFCAERKNHLSADGTVLIYSLFTATDEIVPCRACRFDDYEKWRKSQIALYGEIQPLTKLRRHAPENKSFVNLRDPVEILRRAKDEISREMTESLGTARYDELRGAWKMLIGALGWVKEKSDTSNL